MEKQNGLFLSIMNKSLLPTYSSRSLECLWLNENQPISDAFRFSLPQTQASNMRPIMDSQLQSSPAPSQLIKCTENSEEHTKHCPEIPFELMWLHFPAQNLWIPGAALAGAFIQAGTLLLGQAHTLYLGAAGPRLAQTWNSCPWADAESPSECRAEFFRLWLAIFSSD